jgi:two-component system, chemotaxis family, protein-glutamate methylesterase/glutaminase
MAAKEPNGDRTAATSRDIVVVGGSAGAIDALTRLVAGLPEDLPAAVFVVIHVSPHSRSALPSILNRAGPLPAAAAADAEPIRRGRIYVASPDRHLLIRRDRIRVTRGPRENSSRPAIDALFRSAANAYGPRVTGVVLSGTLDDGSAGLALIKRRGGVAVVQADAAYNDMPQNAIDEVTVDHVIGVDDIPRLISELVREEVHEEQATERSRDVVDSQDALAQVPERKGDPTGLTCPDCGGVLNIREDGPLRYRCRVGHAFTADSLVAGQVEAVEAALWSALRLLEERATLQEKLANRFETRGSGRQAERFAEDAETTTARAALLRRVLLDDALIEAEGPLPTSDEGPITEEEAEAS